VKEHYHKVRNGNPFNAERITITGGEPFFELEITRELIRAAAHRGCAVTIVTSGFWAKTRTEATRQIADLPSFDDLVISYDPHHNRFVKSDFVENAYHAAKNAGIGVKIRLIQCEPASAQELAIERMVQGFAQIDEIEYQRLIKYGRAADIELPGASYGPLERDYCPTSGPHIAVDGTVIPCCNAIMSIDADHPLKLGNITRQSPSEIHESFLRSILLAALKIEGAPRFRSILRKHLGARVDQMSICDLCFEICSSHQIYAIVASEIDRPESKLAIYAFGASQLGMDELAPLVEEIATECA